MKIFFVLPLYNDHVSLKKLIDNICKNLNSKNFDFEFIVIDDASTEDARNEEFSKNGNIHILRLKSNQGNQKSIYTGINYLNDLNKNYDYLIVMDSDGEDNPDDVLKLIDHCKKSNNNSIIFASRHKRNEGFIYKFFYICYKIIFKFLTGKKLNFGNFSCIPHKYVRNILSIPSLSIHYSASILKSNIPSTSILCDKGFRYDGKTKTKISSTILHALKSLSVYYEEIILRFLILSGLGSFFTFISILLIFFNKFFSKNVLIGWSSDMILGLFIVLIILLSIFFASLLILLNKNLYNQNNNLNTQNYKTMIHKINDKII